MEARRNEIKGDWELLQRREEWWKNWYSGGTTPLAGLIIRERDIEKAISDSGNHNLPEVELENKDGCVCICVCEREKSQREGRQRGREGGRRKRIKDEGQRGGC